jgi:hypothetical protein
LIPNICAPNECEILRAEANDLRECKRAIGAGTSDPSKPYFVPELRPAENSAVIEVQPGEAKMKAK